MMKWWYGLVVLVGVLFGLMIFSKNIKNKSNLTRVNGGEISGEVVNLPTIMTISKEGEEKNTHQLRGIVESWSPETGLIEVKAAGKIWEFNLDPTEMMIFIPSIKNKDQMLMVSNREGMRWKTAFCEADYVDVRLEKEKVVTISSSGYRSCGFKGE